MSQKYGNFYVLSFPDRPAYRNECLILDCNTLEILETWSTDSSKIAPHQIVPIIRLLRSKKVKHVESFFGAFENNWTLNKSELLTSENYSNINLHRFKYTMLAVETIRNSTDYEIQKWLDPKRRGSIEFNDLKSTKFGNLNVTIDEFSEISQLILPEWIAFITLIGALKRNRNETDPNKLLSEFLKWRDQLWELRIPWRGLIKHVGLIGFLGGTIRNDFWDSSSGQNVSGAIFSNLEILKVKEWETVGIAKVARNLAFDMFHFHRRNLFESGIHQDPNALRFLRYEKLQTAIISGDRVMNAINGLYRVSVNQSFGLDGYILEIPADNKIFGFSESNKILEEIHDKYPRDPKDLPITNELIPVLISMINELNSN